MDSASQYGSIIHLCPPVIPPLFMISDIDYAAGVWELSAINTHLRPLFNLKCPADVTEVVYSNVRQYRYILMLQKGSPAVGYVGIDSVQF